jgi:hypothetical protein
MYIPVFSLLLAAIAFFVAIPLVRARAEVLNRQRTASWLMDALGGEER